jgi:large subunit ribosomal protein L22
MPPETTAAPAITASAMAKHVRVSPQKARLVLDLIRGQRAEKALGILRFTMKRIAKPIEKILRSAIANAERKADDAGETLDVDHLFVSECFANEGSRWKRLRPAPMGRAFRYQKRTAHIMVGVAEHAVGVQQRAQAAAADEESNKGLRGAVRKARQAVTGEQGKGRRRPSSNPSKPGPKKKK